MNKDYLVLSATLFVAFVVCVKSFGQNMEIAYPDDYRNWTHVKSMVIMPGHALENPFQGIHHIYGNEKAIQGYKNGMFEDGSVIVFDLLNYNEAESSIQETERKLIGIMEKDGKKFNATGGWGFEGFSSDSKTERLVSDGGQSCFACHESAKDNDYVFSKWRK